MDYKKEMKATGFKDDSDLTIVRRDKEKYDIL